MFGVDPTVVGVRRSRLTYGVGVLHRFVPGKHPPVKKITRDQAAWCKDVFDRFVAVDQEFRTIKSGMWMVHGSLVTICGDACPFSCVNAEACLTVKQLATTARSKVHSVTVTNGSPRLVIACYAQGQTQRSLLSIWRTVTWSVNSSVDVTLYSGYGAVDVYRQWRESGHIVGWILPWKANSLSVSPFNHSCIAVRASEPNCTYDISLIITPVNLWLVACLLVGLVLFFSARRCSTNVLFYYGTGVTFGLLASLLIVIFIISRFIPKKSAALTLLGIGFSVTAWLLQYLWQNVQDLLVSYSYYVIIYFVATGVISFAVCYYRGPVTNPRLLDLIRWSIQLVALALIYYSSQIAEVSATIIALVVMITLIPRRFYMLGIPAFVVRYWRRRFPPKIHLLNEEEEYRAQGIEETRKALEELRQYCQSPECNAWKTASRISSPVHSPRVPKTLPHLPLTPMPEREVEGVRQGETSSAKSRFIDWVEGNSSHLTNEMYRHDDNPSPQLPFDSDDD